VKLLVSSSQKLVPFLQRSLPEECSGKTVRRLLEANLCRVNGVVERFGSARLERGDIVEISPAWKSAVSPHLPLQFPTLFEDADYLIVDKPAGWVCDEENCRRTFGPRLKLVHRLDKDTTGVLVLAKHPKSLACLIDLFAKREVHKEYLAIADGIPREKAGVRESRLVRKRTFEGQTIWGSGPKGFFASTRWKKLADGKGASLLLCKPVTGRTHQIRVHLAEMGHPILVDRQYAAAFRCPLFARRPLLHALRIRFGHILAVAPLPLDMLTPLPALGLEVGHLREFLSGKGHGNRRDESDDDEEAEEVGERPHFLHETR